MLAPLRGLRQAITDRIPAYSIYGRRRPDEAPLTSETRHIHQAAKPSGSYRRDTQPIKAASQEKGIYERAKNWAINTQNTSY